MKLFEFNFFKLNPKYVISDELFRNWLKKIPNESNQKLKHLIFENYSLLMHVIKHTRKAKRQRFQKFRDVYFQPEISKQLFPKQEIIQIGSDLGYGVIAKENILPNTFLGEYTGIVRKSNLKKDKLNKYLVRYPIKWNIFTPLVIDAEKHGNHTRFYNHSINPNAQLVSVISGGIFRIIITSIKRIQNESQILLDYGILYWKQLRHLPNDFF